MTTLATRHSHAHGAQCAGHTHPDGWVARFNAAFFDWLILYGHIKYADRKRALFADLPSTVLELGAGAGANFRYLKPGTRVIAVEPNPHMHPRLRARAERYGIELEILGAGGEHIDLPDDSVDAAICTLVLCTVHDPSQAVAEVRRVLAPGGRFLCIEHVAAPPTTLVGRLQRWIARPWAWVFEGCDTHRDTASTLSAAGFSDLAVEAFTWNSIFVPVRPQIIAKGVV